MPDERLEIPRYWEAVTGIRVHDPDGWRGVGGRPYADPISLEEFKKRAAASTISLRGGYQPQ